MNRDRVLRVGIVVFFGIALIAAGVNTLSPTDTAVPFFVQLVAPLTGLALIGYVIARSELTRTRRSAVGYLAGGSGIALSGPGVSGARELGLFGVVFGPIAFLLGVAIFLYGVAVVFDPELGSYTSRRT